MDAATREELKRTLEAERARLTNDLAQIDNEERESLSDASGENVYRDHMADQGSATFERELDLSFEASHREHLEEIEKALSRMQTGTYGSCDRCKTDIPVERLEAVPTATLCIQCKEAEER